jgi:hypothetical protein
MRHNGLRFIRQAAAGKSLRIEISNGHHTLAFHDRCYQREQDILYPLYSLPLH